MSSQPSFRGGPARSRAPHRASASDAERVPSRPGQPAADVGASRPGRVARSSTRALSRAAALAVVVGLVLAGCSAEQVSRGWMPGGEGVTNQTDRITSLWTGSWIAALAIGVLVWGLIVWCVVVYRKRKDDDRLPVQLRYHIPLEIMYVLLPLVMIGVYYYYTAETMEQTESLDATPDVTIGVVGKQWSWDFNYLDSDVHETGTQAEITGKPGIAETLPVLYLPVNERVEFVLDSRDVIHSFWVPAFLYKKDVIPGHTNRFQIVPQKEGTYAGKCAELCGEGHSAMLFNVKVVPRAQYEAHMAELRSQGNTGVLGKEYDRRQAPAQAADGATPSPSATHDHAAMTSGQSADDAAPTATHDHAAMTSGQGD